MDNQTKGYLYEVQIRDYIINELNTPAYLWSDTPETILIEHNIIGSHNQHRITRKENKENSLRDTGSDIIALEGNSCSLVQCKNGYKKGVLMEDVAGFYGWISSLDTLKGYVYYTNKLSDNIICLPKNKRIEYIKQAFNHSENENKEIIYKTHDYQEDACIKGIEHLKKNNRGI